MMPSLFKTDSKKQGILKLDPRTLLYLLLIGNVAVFLMPSVTGEIMLMSMIMVLALLCGVYGFALKLGISYFLLLTFDFLATLYMGHTLVMYVALGFRFIRKIFPCAMLGSILISTTRVGEFMAALTKMNMPKSILIPMTVLLRYFPAIGEDRTAIKKALVMRNISPTLWGFLKCPTRTVECVYVPLMMSASRRADELSAAAVTRGIENPKPRTCITEVHFSWSDFLCAVLATAFIILCVWGI